MRLVPDETFLPLVFVTLLLDALKKEPEFFLIDGRAEARGLVADVFFFVSIELLKEYFAAARTQYYNLDDLSINYS